MSSSNNTPTLTFHKQNADAAIAALDNLAASLVQVGKVDRAKARAAQTVPISFMQNVVAEVEQSEEARKYVSLDVPAAQDRLQYLDAYALVYNRVLKLASEIRENLAGHRAELAFQTRQIYASLARLAKERGERRTSYQILQRELRRKRRAKVEVEPPSAPTTTTPVNPGTAPPIHKQ